ncbi:MAG TPA: response regulator transcription factor [Candidatus Limnocylindrales bacterium]|nr:response regulator transcription factor [Candidatus Limnocylindrales bacterium]
MARILVVDDEPRIVEVVAAYLAREGHEALVAADGDAALEAALDPSVDLVVLDVMLPRRSGFDVLRALRAAGRDVPVLMLTARDDVIDRVAGLEIGADDYVTKPFEPRELVARVSAILRRTGPTRVGIAGQEAAPAAGAGAAGGAMASPVSEDRDRAPGGALDWLDLRIDPAAREVRRGNVPIALTRAEFDLLMAFASRPGVAQTRDQLGDQVFGETFDAFDRTIDTHVKNLRHKLGPGPGDGQYVETIRGIGYRGARS